MFPLLVQHFIVAYGLLLMPACGTIGIYCTYMYVRIPKQARVFVLHFWWGGKVGLCRGCVGLFKFPSFTPPRPPPPGIWERGWNFECEGGFLEPFLGGGWRIYIGRFGKIGGCVCVCIDTHTYVCTCIIQASRSKGRGCCVYFYWLLRGE